MKRAIAVVRTSLQGLGALALAALLVIATFGQGTPFGNGRGAFRGTVYVPSVFGLVFGDNTTTDITLTKNGANVIGVSGNVGGGGSVANTTTAPAGPFAWGQVALSSNTATVVFAKPFTNVPICLATDQTTAQLVKALATASQVVITDTVGATDVVSWACFGNPN